MDFIIKNLNKQGVIIFIDELCKCGSRDSEWSTFLRNELYSLADGRPPVGIKDTESNSISSSVVAKVEDFLKNKTMIIGGAAFQDVWEGRNAPSMGFNSSGNQECEAPKLSNLANYLPRELINRFSSNLFVLPQLKKQDYHDMIHAMAVHVPETWRDHFAQIGLSNLDVAVSDQKGARYAEETLLSALVEVGADHSLSPPKKEAEELGELEFKSDDDELQIF